MKRPLKTTPTGSIWLIGLSAAGKTTLARLLLSRLREHGIPCMLVDGDETRDFLYGEKLGFDKESRRRQTRRIVSLTKWISAQGIIPVVAIMHPFEEDRQWCRETLDGYYEAFLDCSIDTCIERDPKHLYEKALKGEIDMVAGLDMTYDAPHNSDIRLNSGMNEPEALLDIVWSDISTHDIFRLHFSDIIST